VRFVFAREKDGRIHFRKRHPEVAVGEVKQVFEFRMAVQPAYGGAFRGQGNRPYSFEEVPSSDFQMGKNKAYVFILTAYPARRAHVEAYLRTVGGVQ
jgi:hypothetical protein